MFTSATILTLLMLVSDVPSGDVVCSTPAGHECATRYGHRAVLLVCSGEDDSLVCLPKESK